jgi:hypothetical protein
MTLILTAPTRIKLMAYDADIRFAFASEYFVETLDGIIQRPAVLVDDGNGEYPAISANLANPNENYKLMIIGRKFTQGSRETHEAEIELREMGHNVIRYFLARPQLQFSNLRLAETSALLPLQGVKYITIARETMTLYTSGEEQYWGMRLNISITEQIEAEEAIIFRS